MNLTLIHISVKSGEEEMVEPWFDHRVLFSFLMNINNNKLHYLIDCEALPNITNYIHSNFSLSTKIRRTRNSTLKLLSSSGDQLHSRRQMEDKSVEYFSKVFEAPI